MKKLICCYFTLLMISTNLKGQFNLVPNWSFEDTVSCPNNLDQLNRAVGWNSFRESPDYFNSCSQFGGFSGVPLNQFDFQNPNTGNAYSGLFTRAALDYREYIGITLNQPTIIGHKYFASFFINRVGNTTTQHKNIATNKIGIKLSTIQYSFNNPCPIDNYSHVYTDSIITDTLNWSEISGSFIADSTYQYLIIGNFFKDSLTSFIKFDSSANSAYYFIDDVTLIDSTVLGIINPNSSNEEIRIKVTNEWVLIECSSYFNIIIYNIFGEVYLNKNELSTSCFVETAHYPQGIYVINIKTKTKSISRKIIIQ